MDKNKKIELFKENLFSRMEFVYKDLLIPEVFLASTKEGKNLRKQLDKTEYKKFDEDWIVSIESFFPSLNQIIRNVKNTLKYEEEILPIERTRRTNPESIRHLLRNTRYINEINENDEVVPGRILNAVSEIDYGIYENRFIMTLIDRLYNYLYERLETIKRNIHGFKETKVAINNNFKINNTDINFKVELDTKEAFDSSDIDLDNKRIYDRTNEAFKIVSRMYHSNFMQTMSKYKKVKPPILKTQIILKNPDFRNAYMLWLFLDKLNTLDYTLETDYAEKKIDHEYLDNIDKSLMMLFSSIYVNSNLSKELLEQDLSFKSIKPVKSSLDGYTNNLSVKIPEFELESNLATEYHLERARNLFGRKHSENVKINDESKNNLKQVLLDQYSIADQIFNSYFNIDQDDDIFEKLLTYQHPVKKYNQAFDKYLITKAARQVKEKLYLDSIILEDKWANILIELQEEAIRSVKEHGDKFTNTKIEEMDKEFNREIKKISQEETAKTKRAIQNQRKANNETIRNLRKKYNDEIRAYRKEQNERLRLEKAKIDEKRKLEQAKIKEKAKKAREKELAKLRLVRNKKKKDLNSKRVEDKKQIRTNTTEKIQDYRNK